jgi:hypothetical protein
VDHTDRFQGRPDKARLATIRQLSCGRRCVAPRLQSAPSPSLSVSDASAKYRVGLGGTGAALRRD